MNALGRHLLVELNECNREIINNLELLKDAMLEAAIKSGAVILGESFHRFSPQGVSGVVVIAESHLSVHTWPEYGYAAVDVFTCGCTVDPQKAADVLIERLESRNHTITEIKRGVLVTA